MSYNPNNVTVQINSLQALEKLIGGDSQLEIDIRNSVAQAFSKKYLKSLTKTEVKTSIAEIAKSQIVKELKAVIGEGCYDVKLTSKACAKIRETAENEVKMVALKAAQQVVDESLAKVPGYVESIVQREVKEQTQKILAAKQADTIKKITKKLGF